MSNLNSITCPIENKVSLIEASAGTGKTYNIQNLFVRMVMEKGFPIESILVVTFTDAATSELKSRIRTILTALNDYFEDGKIKDFERIEGLAKSGEIDPATKKERIIAALRNFDKASIFTIHGFCKKVLDENVFATSSYFNQALQKNIENIIEEIVRNFFRKYFYNTNNLEHHLKEYHRIDFNSCLKFIKKVINKSNFVFNEDYQNFDFISEYESKLEQVKLNYDRNRILDKLNKKVMYQRANKYKEVDLKISLDLIELYFKGAISIEIFKELEKFHLDKIVRHLKPDKELPQDIFFDKVEELSKTLQKYKYSIYQKLYSFFIDEFEKEKQVNGFRTFDDLIKVLEKYLKKNPKLTNQIAEDFNAVLIDEFQDTDALQYSIFKQIFINQSKPTFLIGDPKQAIYSFRGGDIYAYKTAREDVQTSGGNLYTLPTNYRSTEKMVNAVNDFYKSLPENKEFFSDFIKFHPAQAQPDLADKFYYQNNEIEKALDIYYNSTPTNNDNRDEFSINQTIQKIHELISDSDYQIVENDVSKNISPADIAILVNTHRQADALLPKLQAAGIPAVVQATGSVYDSDEAIALNLLLKAIDSPSNIRAVLGVLTSCLFDISADEIYKMYHDDTEALENWVLFFRNCQKKWQKGSFIEAFNYLVSEKKVKQHLLSFENGNRKITNLFHLQELIQKKEIDSSIGIAGILNWFNRQLNPDFREKDEDIELRLETDEKALKIMTIHKSKGLEFPIVFCPFFWSQKYDISNNLALEYHDENNNIVIDLEHQNILKAEQEALEEKIRLIYVALTRAKYKAFIAAVNNKNLSALNYFLNNIEEDKNAKILEKIKDEIRDLKDFSKIDTINFLECDTPDIANLKYVPCDSNDVMPLKKHQFAGDLEIQWQVNSFSSLHRGNLDNRLEEFKDYDEQENQPEIETNRELNIFTFPAGAKVGSCWHEIFEEIDFNANKNEIKKITEEKLLNYGIFHENNDPVIRQKFIDITRKMVENVLDCQISEDFDIVLRDINNDHKISELEFFFSIKNDVQVKRINTLLASHNISFGDNIPKGFLTGFIDLVFKKTGKYYILDWKSNAIGQSLQDFSPENITMEMQDHKYNLQYLIYTVALHKYLKQRIPDYDYATHFGGVFYVFLRGVNKNMPKSGVYFDLPMRELIEKLDSLLS